MFLTTFENYFALQMMIAKRKGRLFTGAPVTYLFFASTAALAEASLAIGTLKGEQET